MSIMKTPGAYLIEHHSMDRCFKVHLDGHSARLEYEIFPGGIDLVHTWVPFDLEGRGIASALVREALAWCRAHQKKVRTSCPFAAAYVKKHPEYLDLQ